MHSPTIKNACETFLSNVKKSKPHNTWKNYRSDLLGECGLVASLAPQVKSTSPIDVLTEELGAQFIQALLDRGTSSATRQRRASTMRDFFRFAADTYDLPLSVDKLNYKLTSRFLLAGVKNITEYQGDKIQRILDFSKGLPARDLQTKRDIAFLWLLAETGLRVSEACSLKIGQIDAEWFATFIRKGGNLATVRIPKNARAYISAYLDARAGMDEATGAPRSNLPLFARHDQTSGKGRVKSINPKTGESIIHNLALLALGNEYDPKITCHKLRHYFITTIYESKGDLYAAQDMAGHKNISTTQRYAHRTKKTSAISREVFG